MRHPPDFGRNVFPRQEIPLPIGLPDGVGGGTCLLGEKIVPLPVRPPECTVRYIVIPGGKFREGRKIHQPFGPPTGKFIGKQAILPPHIQIKQDAVFQMVILPAKTARKNQRADRPAVPAVQAVRRRKEIHPVRFQSAACIPQADRPHAGRVRDKGNIPPGGLGKENRQGIQKQEAGGQEWERTAIYLLHQEYLFVI